MNILLIQLKRIGDLVLTTPAIAALREKFPGANISLVVSPACQELLPAICGIDRSFVMRGKASDAVRWLALVSQKFDYCFDFTRNDRSSFLTLLSQARKRITADHVKLRAMIRSRSYNELVPCSVRLLHTVDYHLALLQPLGIHAANPEIRLHLPEFAHEKARALLTSERINREFVLIHPGSARREKFWEADRWARVIEHLRDRGLSCILSGGAGAIEQDHITQIKKLSGENVIDLSGKTDLLTLAALVAKANLLLTVDSAPMHFAAAFGTPQVALFGPTNPFHWRPPSSPAVILQGDSGVAIADFLPKQPATLMNQISTEAVINAMEALLSAPVASPL